MIATVTMRVVIADDHPVVRRGVKELLSSEEDIEVVGEASDGQEALRLATELKPDVVVLDISMPNLNGVQAARRVRAACPDTQVVILSVHQVESYVSEALRAGVRGYVVKDASPEVLIKAVRTVARGDSFLSPEVARLVVDPESGDDVRMVSQTLTKREREVCRMLAMGHTVPEIANIIGISRKTVDVHKTRLMKKLNVHNRAELVTFSIQNKLIDA